METTALAAAAAASRTGVALSAWRSSIMGSSGKVAERVGMERTHLYRKLKQLGVKVPRRES